MKKAECKKCNKSFDAIGTHWHHNPDHRETFSNEQKEILTGILMGDGTIRDEDGKNPYMRIKMKNKKYLTFVDDVMGPLSTGVRPVPSEEGIYTMRTRSHPELKEYANWYSSGKKIFPSEIEMTSSVLKHWYCCDGSRSRGTIIIGISNEIENIGKLKTYFEREGLPTPKVSSTEYTDIIRWNTKPSAELFEYMGNAVPGFEYKWLQ